MIVMIVFLIGYLFPNILLLVLGLSFFTAWDTTLAFFSPLIALIPFVVHEHCRLKHSEKKLERKRGLSATAACHPTPDPSGGLDALR